MVWPRMLAVSNEEWFDMVATWGEKLTRKKFDALGPNEIFKAGMYFQQVGQVTALMVAGALGWIFVSKKAKRAAAQKIESIARSLPPTSIVGLTGERLLFFEMGHFRGMRELEAEVPLAQVLSFTAEKKKMAYNVTIRFVDGSELVCEAPLVGRPLLFLEALATIKTGTIS